MQASVYKSTGTLKIVSWNDGKSAHITKMLESF